MKKRITKTAVRHAIKVIELYEEQNPAKYPDDTIIHDKDCGLGLTHGRCYCKGKGQTRLSYELNNVLTRSRANKYDKEYHNL